MRKEARPKEAQVAKYERLPTPTLVIPERLVEAFAPDFSGKITPPPDLKDWSKWTLTDSELDRVFEDAGFPADQWAFLRALVRAESGGRPYALNNNPSSGDLSYGLFQVNMIGRLGPARRKQHGLAHNDDLYDPVVNAKVAFAMSKGKNWNDWGAYTNGSYKKYLP